MWHNEKFMWDSLARYWRKWVWLGEWVPVLGPGVDDGPRRKNFSIEDHGSIVLIRPLHGTARRQLQSITPEDAQWFGGALAVEPRYAPGILDALARGEGL